ncbi:MAG: hypothetical protein IT239_03025 [Bacteroidia bacterium]|nr:hypothetical protein [Bacteroidia bacterium]
MPVQFFDPFDTIYLDEKTCFLTGEDLSKTNEEETINVFPLWLMERYNLYDKKFKMLDGTTAIYHKDLKLPCSLLVKEAYYKLDEEIKSAFTKGYESIKNISEEKLFWWLGKIIYGILYNDLIADKKKAELCGDEFELSPLLKERFRIFHLMLQSIVSPVYFSDQKPWSILVVKTKYSQDIFNYREDAVNLISSISVNGFGIVACLQDNEIIKSELTNLLEKITDKELHPIQFEELYARFIYTKYLLQYKPKYKIEPYKNGLSINGLSFEVSNNKSLFAAWDNTMYAQVLTEYWKPWGFTMKEVVSPPNPPISFLEDEITYQVIDANTIELPY